ncbi:MAG: dihydroorotate dehydrogenase electron transfer subunit [Magnetococcales bacterium]|nr:dihydroorotate dehydrogenase electron transfer subunit [Magnetococcales bacterium]
MTTPESNRCRTLMHHQSAKVVFNRTLSGGHGLVRLQVGSLARQVHPGQFLQLSCDASLTLPRPFSIMNADHKEGTVDLFYRVVGRGTELMAAWKGEETVFLLMPLGQPFALPDKRANVLLIAGGAGLAPVHFLARRLVARGQSSVLVWGIETNSPLKTIPARLDGFPLDVQFVDSPVALAGLDTVGVSSRLASMDARSGHFQGYVTDLADHYLKTLTPAIRSKTVLYACGPIPMLRAVGHLAEHFGLWGQVSMEERMACGFGGCAACVAPLRTPDGSWSYRKICTDGPVFPIADIAWDRYLNH